MEAIDPTLAARSAAPVAPPAARAATRPAPGTGPNFRQVLEQQTAAAPRVRFSKHAQERLDRRQIALTTHHLARLDEAVARAHAKGARESLVLMDDLALIVSVRNQTVITATNAASREENVFTNIDSAVIA